MKTRILNNIELKILSVIIGVILWTAVRGENRGEVFLNINIELKNLPKYLTVTYQNDDRIKLRLNGPKTLISKMNESYFKPYVVDLAGIPPGEVSLDVLKEKFAVEKGIRIVDISPETINLKVDMLEKKDLPIEPSFTGKLDKGYEIESYDVLPEKVNTRGPRSLMDRHELIKTAPIDLTGKKKSFVDKYPLVIPKGLSIEDGKGYVVVNVLIREEFITRIIKNVPVKLVPRYSDLEVETKEVNVKITGSADKVNGVKRNDIVIYAKPPQNYATDRKRGGRFEGIIDIKATEGLKAKVLTKVFFVFKGKEVVR